MSNIATAGGAALPAELSNLGSALMQEGQSATGISDLLRFMAREGGIWVFGAEAVENADDNLWAINPLSFEHGYVCWKDKKIAGEAMVAVGVAKPAKESLEDHGVYVDGKGKTVQTTWDEQMVIRLKCVEGPDAGVEVDFKTSTYGGIQCIKAMAKAVGARIQSGAHDVVAVVSLENDSYQHKDHGKTYTPVMEIQSWMLIDGAAPAEEPAEAESEPEEPPAPTRSRRRRSA